MCCISEFKWKADLALEKPNRLEKSNTDENIAFLAALLSFCHL